VDSVAYDMDFVVQCDYENQELCALCGGACCRRCPGATHPSDWPERNFRAALVTALVRGFYALDYGMYEGPEESKQVFYVRPSIRGSAKVVEASWGGQCAFLADNGCVLDLDKRPAECRHMEPRMAGFGYGPLHCWGHGSRRQTLEIWRPYQNLVIDAACAALGERKDHPWGA